MMSDWWDYLMMGFVGFIVLLLVALIYGEIKYPCLKYSEETYTTWVMSGKVMVPIQSHRCLERTK